MVLKKSRAVAHGLGPGLEPGAGAVCGLMTRTCSGRPGCQGFAGVPVTQAPMTRRLADDSATQSPGPDSDSPGPCVTHWLGVGG